MDRYAHVISYVLSTPWAIRREYAAIIQHILLMRRHGHRFTAEEVEANIGAARAARSSSVSTAASIAVIPIVGVIEHRMEAMGNISGGMSPDTIAKAFDAAFHDSSVSSIVLDFDTPGGTVFGLMEVADKIRGARGKKLVVGVANGIAASAGYWLLSQCEEAVVTPSGQVGSIGVVSMHENISEWLKNEGIEVTLIHSSKYKVEGNPFGPLGEEAYAAVKADVDAYDSLFVRAVAKGRGVPVEKVRSEFGQGRMVMAQDALARGMVDAVETFDDVIARLSKPKKAAYAGAAAVIESPAPAAEEQEPLPVATPSHDYFASRIKIAQRKGAEHGVPA
jgi:signal peptide peptidase SppA